MQLSLKEIQKILPHRYPFLLIDRITECVPSEMAEAVKCVSGNEPYFQGHFPGEPIMPGVLILEAMAQVGGVAMLYPEEFSAALFMSGGGGILPRTGPVRFENAVEVDIPALAKQNVAEGKKLPKLFFTCGDKDGGFENSRKSAEAMKELGYDVTWEAVPGYAHEWDFWDLSLRKAFDQWLPLKNAAIEPEEGR